MLISRVPDEGAGRGEPAEITRNCQTASELFNLMTKDHDFEAGDDPLTTSDLVLLYKNIDLGSQLMSNVRRPNQYVENVYHADTESDSDLGESCSSEELRNIMLANKERIDLFTPPPSVNSLCHKLGDLEIQVSNISNDLYDDRHCLNRDPFINEQLQHLKLMSKANELNTLLPASLLDYICCKRLEDNYNFYMDDIITYVKHTIDQLKRISNGDYLPEKVRKKWRESDPKSIENASKILTTSISMPLQVKQKTTGMTPIWDEIVHTEMDLRSLLKIMEKKIVLEVPRTISDSYTFISRYNADEIVMSCSRRRSEGDRSKTKSRVDVVLSVQRAAVGQLVSNIRSIMVLQPEHQTALKDCTAIKPLEYQNSEHADDLIPKVIELPEMEQNTGNRSSLQSDEFGSICSISDAIDSKESDCKSKEDSGESSAVARPGTPEAMAQILTTAARVVRAEAAFNHATPNDLHFSMTTINPQISLSEQNTSDSFYTKPKKKSPERARIKSPYENKSFILEERRRRLLEIKGRRERRKMASNENSKGSIHKPFPQAVSSVTKLSITNKSFYNSIYGRCGNGESNKRKCSNTINMKTRQEAQTIDEEIEESEEDVEREIALSDRTYKKISKGHFLDDTETEMSYLQSKHDGDPLRISTSTSANSKESITYFNSQSECCSPLVSVKVNKQESATPVEKQRLKHEIEIIKPQDALNKVPTETCKGDNDNAPALECRRSLEKIYTLMKKLQQIETSETTKKKAASSRESRGLISESGSSLKRRVSFSNPRLEKLTDRSEKAKETCENSLTNAVPKVVISVKPQTKLDEKNRGKAKPPRVKLIPDTPLKAISQLLRDIDNVQKSRTKIADPKSINRSISTENEDRIQKRRTVGSLAIEDPKVTAKVKNRFVREDKPEVVKPQVLEKKINDMIDAAKEARGEAVRGPPRFSSRLNALAQPKRTYVQALAEELPKRQTADRVQRTGTRRRTDPCLSPGSIKAPHSSLERTTKPRRSNASSPDKSGRPAADALQTIKKKVAVEPARWSAERVGFTRAPLLPWNVELSSGTSCATDDGQSSSIGLKLHRMVNDMLRTSRPSPATADVKGDSSPPLAAPACDVEPKETQIVTEKILVENTAIEEIFTPNNEPSSRFENAKLVTPANSSVNELEELEHALHRNLSSGTFASRLRVNKLTLSPRPSKQRGVMHQSGDTTLVLKSHPTQKIQGICQSFDQESDLMGLLSKTRLNYGFSGFPLQISTVGYAFPTFKCEIKNVMPRIVNTDTFDTSAAGSSSTDSEETMLKIKAEEGGYTSQCLADEKCITREGVAAEQNLETEISSDSAATAGSGNKKVTASLNKIDGQSPDYTSSFEILVGLLNEIQKITTCESDAISAQALESHSSESSPGGSATDRLSSSGDAVSSSCMSSDDPLGSSETKSVSAEAVELKAVCENKEVLARVAPNQVAASTSQQAVFLKGIETSTCTDLPASNHSVSAFTHSEYCDIACNTLTLSGDKTSVQTGMETNRTSVKSLVPYYNNIFKVKMKKEETHLPLTQSVATDTGTKRNVAAVSNILVDIAPVQKSKRILDKCEEVKIVSDQKEVNKFCLNVVDLDSTLKVKRDILVTFYSVLVLTVFAALAFPEMLQYA
ncbi:uncharacterized protein LOC134669471 [Cydia fagiglandana]|uniref:uncharacterized protein LOC134669471 n=1 Tax=Cydia fagiglandana TaxID=1458189 RepID=UPI002FEDF4AF